MPISEDIKSVHAALAGLASSLSSDKTSLVQAACSNLLALAEQVEVLETIPLAMYADPVTACRVPYPHALQ